MSLKKERSHLCGKSNIDFRSKKDIEALKLYEPWKIPKDFGTMGKELYYPTFTNYKKVFSVSRPINKLTNLVENVPNPKIYGTALYYKNKGINLHTMEDFRAKRVAELDESYIGKEKFTGDSMMISDINKFRLERKNRKNETIEKKRLRKQNELKMQLAKTKKNKEALQETQLVRIEAKETLEGKIDLNKIQEIRLALRRRYGSRRNLRSIFKDWDKNDRGEISVYEAHEMINNLNIPINFNETRILIASSNKRGTESLNMEEFIHLIFSDNETLKINLNNLPYRDEKLFSEGKELEQLKTNLKKDVIEINQQNDILLIKNHIHSRTSIINLAAKNNKINANKCSKDEFLFLMKTMRFPDKYYKDTLMDLIFNSYINEDKETMNMNKFCDECLSMVEANNFNQFKDKLKDSFEVKIKEQEKNKENFLNNLQEEDAKRKTFLKGLNLQIEEKNEKIKNELDLINRYKTEVLNPQPNTEFIKKMQNQHKLAYEKLNKIEESYSTKPNLLNKQKPKTRFNANPEHKNTFYIVSQDPNGSSYINEKDRFSITTMDKLTDFIKKDKEERILKENAKLLKIKKFEDYREKTCKNMEKLFELKDLFAQNKRSLRIFNYENTNKLRNDLIE